MSEALSGVERIVVVGDGELLALGPETSVSRDQGKTWQRLDIAGPLVDASPHHAVGPGGAFHSTDVWRTVTRTFDGPLVHVVEGEGGAWASDRRALRRFEGGTWKKLDIGSKKAIDALAVGHGAMIASVGHKTIHRSTDGGATFRVHSLERMKAKEKLIRLLVLEDGFLGITNEHPKRFWFSTDGASWAELDPPVPWHWVAVVAADQVVLAGVGEMWAVLHSGQRIEPLIGPGTEIRALEYGPDDMGDDRVWATDGKALYRDF